MSNTLKWSIKIALNIFGATLMYGMSKCDFSNTWIYLLGFTIGALCGLVDHLDK